MKKALFFPDVVLSTREEASKIGVEIMKKNGNAFDAMLANGITFEPNSFSNAVLENPKKKRYFCNEKEKESSGAVGF